MNEPEAGAFHVGVSVGWTARSQVAQRVPPQPGAGAVQRRRWCFPKHSAGSARNGGPGGPCRASEDSESLHLHGWILV